MEEKKRAYRATNEERRKNKKRVFSFKFTQKDQRHQKARELLEAWEAEYMAEYGLESPLAEIFTSLIIEHEYGTPKPLITEKRMMDIVMKRLDDMGGMLKDIYERDPIIVQGAIEAYKERNGGDEIEDDFIGGMFDDFENTGERD